MVDIGGAGQRRTRGDERLVRDRRIDAGARLNENGVSAAGCELLDCLGCRRNASFTRFGFGRNADAHQLNPSATPDSVDGPAALSRDDSISAALQTVPWLATVLRIPVHACPARL